MKNKNKIEVLKNKVEDSMFFYMEELTGGKGVKWDNSVKDWDMINDVYELRNWIDTYINKGDRKFKIEETLFECFKLL